MIWTYVAITVATGDEKSWKFSFNEIGPAGTLIKVGAFLFESTTLISKSVVTELGISPLSRAVACILKTVFTGISYTKTKSFWYSAIEYKNLQTYWY